MEIKVFTNICNHQRVKWSFSYKKLVIIK